MIYIIHSCSIVVSWVFIVLLAREVKQLKGRVNVLNAAYKGAAKLIFAETKRKEQYTQALKRLTDPESIEEDMEKGARVREMHDANRTTLPREDAGPPAKVYSPQLRAKVPKSNYKR